MCRLTSPAVAFPVDETRIDAVELELGQRLSEDHRARLRENNGGEVTADLVEADFARDFDPDWELYPVWDDSDRRRAARTARHIVHETTEARSWPGFPADAVAVAGNGTGDQLIVRGGAVEWWDHETGETRAVRVSWRS